MENEPKSMTTKELTRAVSLLLEREETRVAKQQRHRRLRAKRKRQEMRANIDRLGQSIEVIKWCIVGITGVMAVSLLVVILVILEVEREAERIKGEVEIIQKRAQQIVDDIDREAEAIRDKLQNPLRAIGGALGGQLDQEVRSLLGAEEE